MEILEKPNALHELSEPKGDRDKTSSPLKKKEEAAAKLCLLRIFEDAGFPIRGQDPNDKFGDLEIQPPKPEGVDVFQIRSFDLRRFPESICQAHQSTGALLKVGGGKCCST